MFNFEKLDVYQEGIKFAEEIYRITKKFPADERFGLVDQLKRAAVSISANIAEGSARSKKDFIHFLNISRSSAYECIPLSRISFSQGYISEEEYKEFYNQIEKVSAMLSGLINSLKKTLQ